MAAHIAEFVMKAIKNVPGSEEILNRNRRGKQVTLEEFGKLKTLSELAKHHKLPTTDNLWILYGILSLGVSLTSDLTHTFPASNFEFRGMD